MASWTQDKNAEWIVIAKQSEIVGGQVTVTKRSGETQTVIAAEVSRPFMAKYGQYTGQQCVFVTPRRESRASGASGRCIACEYSRADQTDEFGLARRMEQQYGIGVDHHTCGMR